MKHLKSGEYDTSPIRRPKDDDDKVYPCLKCGRLRSKNQGGTTFTHCERCWPPKKRQAKRPPVSDRRLRDAALEWAKAKLREAASYFGDSPETRFVDGECTQRLKERRVAEIELLRLCVKLMARSVAVTTL